MIKEEDFKGLRYETIIRIIIDELNEQEKRIEKLEMKK